MNVNKLICSERRGECQTLAWCPTWSLFKKFYSRIKNFYLNKLPIDKRVYQGIHVNFKLYWVYPSWGAERLHYLNKYFVYLCDETKYNSDTKLERISKSLLTKLINNVIFSIFSEIIFIMLGCMLEDTWSEGIRGSETPTYWMEDIFEPLLPKVF